jgi:hypothetical protein
MTYMYGSETRVTKMVVREGVNTLISYVILNYPEIRFLCKIHMNLLSTMCRPGGQSHLFAAIQPVITEEDLN